MKCEMAKLGEYLYIKGRIGWKGLKKREYLDNSKYRIINGETLSVDGIDWGKAGYITEERYMESPEIMLKENDILISKDGTIGKIGYVDKLEIPTTVASGIFVIRNERPEIIDTKFIYHFLCSPYFKTFIEMRTEGSVIPHLYQKDFVNLDFPLYPLHVQQKITSILNMLDEKMDLNKEINKNLQQQVQLLYENFVTTINEIPITIAEVIDVRDGTHDSPKPLEVGYPLITSKHLLPFGVDVITPNKISESDYNKVNERSKVDTNDILLSMIGTVGVVSLIIEEKINFAIKNVGLFKTSKCPQFTYYLLCYLKSKKTIQHIEKCLASSTQKYISLTELRKMPIIIPNTVDINKFNDLVTPLFTLIIENVKENKVLTAIRDSLLPKLMSGELAVSDIDF